MVTAQLSFHIPPDADPMQILTLLENLGREREALFSSQRELLDFAEQWNIDNRSEIPSFATFLGFLDNSSKGISISSRGLSLIRFSPQVRPDIVHMIVYSLWSTDLKDKDTVSWSYRQICNYYWDHSPVNVLDSASTIVGEVTNMSELVFTGVVGYDSGHVSFSPKSVRGARKWLEVLRPPVIEDNIFIRRHFCAPELLVLALGWVAQETGGQPGIDLLLTPERRDLLCRACLLDPTALDRALDWMLPLYPKVIEPGTRTGVYGRFVRLKKYPTLQDLVT